MNITKKLFGTMPKKMPKGMVQGKYTGREIYNYILENDHNMTVEISEYGACIVRILVPDKNGVVADVQLGYDDLTGYIKNNECFGALVGRHANRIAGASFKLNGKEYTLENNDKGNNLHSSVLNGYFRRPWDFAEMKQEDDAVSVKLHLLSPDGDQGFPGNFDLTVRYTLKQDGSFCIKYEGVCDKDTVVNLTNHSYFNLAGHDSGSVLDQIVWIDSDYVLETRKGNMPTGKILEIADTPLDFNAPKPLIKDFFVKNKMLKNAKGYDFNYILKSPGTLSFVAYMKDLKSGRKMEIYTDLPGLQLYTGNFLGKKGKGGHVYEDHTGACFESQQFPDAIHFDEFPNNVLKANEHYETTTIFKFLVEE